MTEPRRGLSGRLAARSVSSRLTPLGVLAAIGLGLVSVLTTPREEEPQIIVPMVDVVVPMPGATPAEVEAEVTTGLERRLWGIPGVEYVYSTSARDGALLTARFKVNQPLEPSLVKVRQEIEDHPELLPPRAGRPSVTLVTIDDVPVVTVTLHGGDLAPGALWQLGQEGAALGGCCGSSRTPPGCASWTSRWGRFASPSRRRTPSRPAEASSTGTGGPSSRPAPR